MSTPTPTYIRHIYWIEREGMTAARAQLRQQGIRLSHAQKTPCETLNARGNKVVAASPAVFNRVCKRQGSWYRESPRHGMSLLVSEARLPAAFDPWLDAVMTKSDFQPGSLPDRETLQSLVDEPVYQQQKPAQWEQTTWSDAVLFKILFTLTRFWKRGDTLGSNWLNHRANHANFLSRRFTTRIEGDDVAYTVSENAAVCSSCVEFFNLVTPEDRKLARACPGAITFSTVERDDFYDIKPVVFQAGRTKQ